MHHATAEIDNPIPGPRYPYLSHSHPQVSQSFRYGCDSLRRFATE